MNFNIFDSIDGKKKETWVNPRYKRLYSTVIKKYNYYCITKRFNSVTKSNDYYLLLTNETDDNFIWNTVGCKRNITKYSLANIWNVTKLKKYKSIEEVVLTKVDEDKNSAIYYIDI